MLTNRLAWSAATLASVLTSHASAQPICESEQACSVKKPNVLLVLDYSSSMSGIRGAPAYFPPGQTMSTRWDAALDAASWILLYEDGLFARNARVGLARFAHDPEPELPGTTITTDRSFPAITDGFAIDVPFDGSSGSYLECKSSGVDAALEVLRSTPPPLVETRSLDASSIMLTWTRGALRSAHELVQRTRASHAGEPGEERRDYEVVLMTDGDWTCPDRTGQSCDENPAGEAERLRQDGIPVHVIAFGDAAMQPSLNEIALLGGTGSAVDATSPRGIVDALSTVLARIRDGVIVPICTQKLPRVLVTIDASTSMLVGDAAGASKWDKARFALAGNPAAPNPGDPGYVESVLSRRLQVGSREVAIEDVVHFGMVAFATASEQKLIAGFGPCMRDNFAWALDPATSCRPPGCSDPYGGYPIEWTFQNSDRDRQPPFVRTTQSHMPACNQTSGSDSCVGQTPTTFTGQGLEFARKVISDYKQDPKPFKIADGTRFVNVLVTDGQTSEGSSNVQDALRGLTEDGVDTYVIGFGSGSEIDRAQLDQYAAWGNTERAIVVDPNARGAAGLADALAGVVTSLGLESCCVLNDCSLQPEPQDPRAVCGDGKIEGEEACDDGADNASYGHCGGLCDRLHLYCGDERVDGPEECDDGNVLPLDGCDPRCVVEPAQELDAGADAGGERPARDRAAGPGSVRTLPVGMDAGKRPSSTSNLPPRMDEAADEADDDTDARPHKRDGGCRLTDADARATLGDLAWLSLFTMLLVRRTRCQRAARR